MEDFMDSANSVAVMSDFIGSFNSDIHLVWPEWKYKSLTFSYDDATVCDRRLVEIFNRYGMKGTFNVSSSFLDRVRYVSSAEISELYAGHEIACHGKNHLRMPDVSAARQEQENQDWKDTIDNLGSQGSVEDIAKDELGLVDPNTQVITPQQ